MRSFLDKELGKVIEARGGPHRIGQSVRYKLARYESEHIVDVVFDVPGESSLVDYTISIHVDKSYYVHGHDEEVVAKFDQAFSAWVAQRRTPDASPEPPPTAAPAPPADYGITHCEECDIHVVKDAADYFDRRCRCPERKAFMREQSQPNATDKIDNRFHLMVVRFDDQSEPP